MNQERLDDLAAGLAKNSLSRRQVLKSLATGLLLSGPLGALWAKPTSAATCVQASCVESAQQAYDKCTGPNCNRAFVSKLNACGCVTLSFDTSGTVTPSACADPCLPTKLETRANKNVQFKRLSSHFRSDTINGWTFDAKSDKAVVYRQNGKLTREALLRYYRSKKDPAKVAVLYYLEGANGAAVVYAGVFNRNQRKLNYSLAYQNGRVEKGYPPKSKKTATTAPVQTKGSATTPTEPLAAPPGFATCEDNVEAACSVMFGAAAPLFGVGPCLGTIGKIRNPRAAAFVAAVCLANAAQVWFFSTVACAAIAKKACACKEPQFSCGDVCCSPCETARGCAACRPRQCTSCEKCDPTTGGCLEDRAKTCNGVCCPEGETCCGGSCTNTQWDEDNCGGCNTPCPKGKRCTDGRCECPPGDPNCGGGKGNPES